MNALAPASAANNEEGFRVLGAEYRLKYTAEKNCQMLMEINMRCMSGTNRLIKTRVLG